MTEVIMPKMGDGMEEGTLLEWLKADGDSVKSGEVIATIQTDKASLEMESPGAGTLTGFLIKAGDTVPVGKPMAALLKSGEKLPDGWGSGSAAAAPVEAKPDAQPEGAPKVAEAAPQAPTAVAPVAPVAPVSEAPATSGARVKASPLARKIAEAMGVDLSGVAGSGPGGRIVEKDVRTAPTSAPQVGVAAIAQSKGDQTVPLNKIRQITAKRTAESKQTVPHFYVVVEVDLEAIQVVRSQFEASGDFKPSINDFVLKACALALRDMPGVNSSYQGDHLIEYGAVNIGMAVALDDGLTVATLANVDQLTIRQISALSKDLASRARSNKLTLAELSGSTFSISNMGMLNVTEFMAIVNQPNSGILAISTARRVVVPTEADDEVEVRTKMNISGSFDHRVVDGAVGARFVNAVREYLENPMRLLN